MLNAPNIKAIIIIKINIIKDMWITQNMMLNVNNVPMLMVCPNPYDAMIPAKS